jgi:hypothetical protein
MFCLECLGRWKQDEDEYLVISFPTEGSDPKLYCFRVFNDTNNGRRLLFVGHPSKCHISTPNAASSNDLKFILKQIGK